MRRFTLFSPGGLANQLKVLVSGQVLAAAAGAELEVLWVSGPACACPFTRLFAPDPAVRDVSAREVADLPTVLGWDEPPPDLLATRAAHVVLGHMSWFVHPSLYPAHAALWPLLAERLAALTPAPPIAAAVEAFVAANSSHPQMIGVHLRRGDFRQARPDVFANTDAALAALERHLARAPDAGIYLASDDGAASYGTIVHEGVHARFTRRFGARVVRRPARSLDRATPEAIEDALIELLLLRRCDAIVGTAASSFSDLAAFGRDVPTELVAGVDPRVARLERFARRAGLHPLIMALARRRLGREPLSFFAAYHAVRFTPLGERLMRIVKALVGTWRP